MSQPLTFKSSVPQKAVDLTDGAIDKLRQLIDAEGDETMALRLAVKAGGCSGFSYEMFFDNEFDAADTVEEFDGVKVVVDSQSLEMVRGATLDYKDALTGAGFAINNPNVTRSCGCGNSFS
ncbi:MAG: iron-sulfur cluster assembly accessory protein [Acidimicrobiia bacterium]|nr:iron-sulfur cluster assembly accessory protein [Acidimicrobiia bacterium]